MEKIQILNKSICAQHIRLSFLKRSAVAFVFLPLAVSCSSSHVMEDKNARFEDINEEFSKVARVKEDKATAVPKTPSQATVKPAKAGATTTPISGEAAMIVPLKPVAEESAKVVEKAKPVVVKKQEPFQKVPEKKMEPRKPDYEDSEGFQGRRPLSDPFREGEKVVYDVTHNFLAATAGELTIEVRPHQLVNEKKAYHFSMHAKTSKLFSTLIYAVDNFAETMVDYDTLVPVTYSVSAKETSRIKESRVFFDLVKSEATQWEKEVKKGGKEKKKKKTWTIDSYTQNVISAIYYLRNFKLTVGKKFEFRVADDGKNYTFKGEVLREEKLKTDIGEFDTVVVQPQFKLDGEFKPTGENYIWLTKDDRKLIVQIKSKIKIGSIFARVKKISGPK